MEQWMNSPYVDCWVDMEENEEIEINEKLISWFDIKTSLSDTEDEKREKQEAIKEQIQEGILLPNGVPPGVQMPPKTVVKPPIMTRQQKRKLKLQERNNNKNNDKWVHPVKQLQEVKNGFKLSPLALKLQQQMQRGKGHDQ